jgi:elongation factor P
MNNENYEQFQLDISILKERENLLEDGMQLTCVLVDGKIINIRFPKSIEVKLVYADAVVKGQTASTSFKNATTQNGIKVLVPPHIKEGDKILINTENLEYLEKSKS